LSGSDEGPEGPRIGPERDADIDLRSLFTTRSGVTITTPIPEDPPQRDHRIREEARDNSLRRFKDSATFVLGWALIISVAVSAARVAFDNTPEHATIASWGRTILGTLIGALAGYVIGRKN
jgi:hypothetical protein